MSALKEAELALKYWKDVLGLASWRIELAIVPILVIPTGEAMIEVNWECETARITILDPESYTTLGLIGEQSIERSIVHELLHALFEPIEPEDKNGLEWRIFENTLDRVARSLVTARNG